MLQRSRNFVSSVLLLSAIGLGWFGVIPVVLGSLGSKAIAQSTFVPGPWQPVGRVNPSAPYKILIKNQSGIPLEYSLTTGEIEVRPLANQGTAELTNLPQEVFLLIDPIPSAREITLRYEIQVTDQNMVNVTVKPSPDPTGVHTINIQPDGAIYVY